MGRPIVIVGLGEMGAAFAHGWLRQGHTVVPVNRGDDPRSVEVDPALVLVAVGERALDGVLSGLPDAWRDRVALLQNELLPTDWERHALVDPTIAAVWFEKKRSKPLNVVLPTVVAGPHAALVVSAVTALQLPAEAIAADRLLFELVKKNLYILTANIAGLVVGGTVSDLWRSHKGLARDVALEVLALQAWRAKETLPEEALIDAMVEAFHADPNHLCTGRSAAPRLDRALAQATEASIDVPTLRSIAERRSLAG
ncbi:MAG: hypothetical protein H6719_28525 [Sandaracinaceae bacterium]|nr:hypothetical protein [Sandaracinaceae bacterium]